MIAYFDQNLWNSTLPEDSYRESLHNKKLLLIGIGGRYKYHILKRLRALGVGHIVVLDTPDSWFEELVDGVIEGNPYSPLFGELPGEDPRIQAIQHYQIEHGVTFDGIWTFADRCVVPTAQIAEYFSRPGLQTQTIIQLKNKQILREWLYEHRELVGRGVPHVVALPRLDIDHITTEDYPCIIKGVESFGKSCIHIAHSREELHEISNRYSRTCITAESYFEGTDIDLNVLVQNGKIEWYGFVENLDALQPGFLEDGSIAHHSITSEEQAELVQYMQNICDCAKGIHSACLHVEFRIRRDEEGFAFTLIEINFRMGGVENFAFHLGRDGHDLILSNCELAFGLPLTQTGQSLRGIYPYMGNRNYYSYANGTLTSITPPSIHPGIIEYLFNAPIGTALGYPPGMNDDIGWVLAGSTSSPDDVPRILDRALDETKIEIG